MEIKERIKRGWEVSAEGYTRMIQEDFLPERMQVWLDLLLAQAPREGKLRILDVGTGPGLFATILSKAGHEVVGIDISPKMLQEARQNSAKCGVYPDFKLMNSQKPEFPENKFDMIVSRNVVWCMDEPEEAYRNWLKILAPGGKIVVIDGDYLRDLRDEEYRAKKAAQRQKYVELYGEPPTSYKDFQVARGWRTELPLVPYARPQWDVETLTRLGYEQIHWDDISEVGNYSDKKKMLNVGTVMFLLSASKPRQAKA